VVSFTPRGRIPRYPLDKRLGEPKTGLDDMESSYRDSNSEPSAVQPVASRYTDCAIPNQDLILKAIPKPWLPQRGCVEGKLKATSGTTRTDEGCLLPSCGWSRCLQRQKHQPPPAASITKQNEPTVLMPSPLRHIGSSSITEAPASSRGGGGANFHPKISKIATQP
jgi:hypothetical protein